ncbi:hypothetical protein E4T42_07532 [Aureobasidium subglaciale]|nr:hypothetical protein E4T38_06834 [Aureobasidium subglaciale]KAI5218776.1 hypothetical protein E4T40_06756 [Aureobasidium subglaciale]KAI5222388.1 hypothetical protein E4T41_06685 [Aureobasidium subglaciale]KAI5242910.1 hypothetical protein E4T42_07532 [Aureobasidium subglaciale]KAI5259831.1 hypothetical protein E4T46_06562 [Aureobasidium subglaciale]
MRCCILRQVCNNFDIRIGYASSRISPQMSGGAVGMMSVIKEGRSDQKRPFFFSPSLWSIRHCAFLARSRRAYFYAHHHPAQLSCVARLNCLETAVAG